MKYINNYKLFENSLNIDDIKKEAVYAFADLTDLDYFVNVYPNSSNEDSIYIYVENVGKGSYKDIKETLLFAIPYLEEKYSMKFSHLEFDSNRGDFIFREPEYIEDKKFNILFLRFE